MPNNDFLLRAVHSFDWKSAVEHWWPLKCVIVYLALYIYSCICNHKCIVSMENLVDPCLESTYSMKSSESTIIS